METTAYLATTLWVIGVNTVFLIATLFLLKSGNASIFTRWIFGSISIIWIIFIDFISSNKFFFSDQTSGSFFFIFTLASASLALFLIYISPIKKIFETITQENIQIVQGLRVFVATGFLMEGVLKVIPGWFSIMDGFLHVTSGFLALIAAYTSIKKTKSSTLFLWLANAVGVLDIIIIVSSINFVVWDEIGAFHNMQYVVFYTGVILLWLHFASISKLIHSSIG